MEVNGTFPQVKNLVSFFDEAERQITRTFSLMYKNADEAREALGQSYTQRVSWPKTQQARSTPISTASIRASSLDKCIIACVQHRQDPRLEGMEKASTS